MRVLKILHTLFEIALEIFIFAFQYITLHLLFSSQMCAELGVVRGTLLKERVLENQQQAATCLPPDKGQLCASIKLYSN